MKEVRFTILGEAASKANSREIVVRGGKPASIKSEKALKFEANALKQIPPLFRVQLTGPVRATLRIFYASERPDLDESIVLDVLQDRYKSEKLANWQKDSGIKPRRILVQKGVYVNDRQVREKHIYHGIDRANPRIEVLIEPLTAQQEAFALEMPACDPLEV